MRLFNKKTFLLLAFVLFSNSGLASGLSTEVDLEVALEKRISPMVLRFDPNALIRINVTMKKISAPLPGTAIEVENFSGSSDGRSFSEAEIANTTVTIYTTKDPFPNFLRKEISDALTGMKATVKVSAMSDEAKSSLGAADQTETERNMALMKEFLENYGKQSRSLSIFLSVAIGLTLLIAVGVGTGVAFSLQKRGSNEMSRLVENRLVPVLKELGGTTEERGGGNKPTVLQATLTASPDTFKGSGGSGGGGGGATGNAADVTSLDVGALEAILSDCYWCQFDTYAAWLWSVMSPAQRTAIYGSKKIDKEYLKLVQALPKDRYEDHLDPTYLNPPGLHLVSQDDLARWVEGFLPGFHLLSPMRQATLPISLKTRLACAAETVDEKTKILPFPEKVSQKRKIKKVQKFNDPTFEDETTILHNPSMVKEEMRPQLKSLVWLSLRQLDYRKMVLSQYSAEQLAEAWIGSPEILARLIEALPEKKRLMLEGYLKTTSASKKSPTYLRLVESGWNDEVAMGDMQEKKAA
jgi:hypothetical protein